MTKPARPLSLAAAWMAVIILAVSCAGESPPSPCIAAAQDAGLPDGVVDQLRDPGDLEAGEWLDLHRVLDEADISDVCGQITAPAEGEQEEEAPEPGGELPDATPVSQEAEHPEAPAPSLEHSARIPEEDEHRRRCRFWALNNLQPIVYQEFAKLDPETMDDLDRILWRSILHPHAHLGFYDNDDARGDAIPSLRPKEPGILCRDYWAEPVGPTNAGLRNHGLEAQCRRRLEERITSRYFQLADAVNYQEDSGLVYETPNQYVRILQWLDMSGEDLLTSGRPPYVILREQSRYPYAHMQDRVPDADFLVDYRRELDGEVDLEWLGILAAAGMSDNSSGPVECLLYYPQVFYGYWVPVDPGDVPDHGDDRETDLVEYDSSTMPILLPESVDAPQVRAGYPLGRIGEEYHRCSGESEAEQAGYYFVDHPTGAYCERIR